MRDEDSAARAVADEGAHGRVPAAPVRAAAAERKALEQRLALHADERHGGLQPAVGEHDTLAAGRHVEVGVQPEPVRRSALAAVAQCDRAAGTTPCARGAARRERHGIGVGDLLRQQGRLGRAVSVRERVPGARLGGEVVGVEGRGRMPQRHDTSDPDAVGLERGDLVGVVGQQLEGGGDAEQPAREADLVVAAAVVREPHPRVGLEGGETVPARLHHHAIARLGDEAGAAPLLHEVEDDAAAGAREWVSAASSCSAQSQSQPP